jgi:RNA polymerase sigma-70 factor (sigma-E family)
MAERAAHPSLEAFVASRHRSLQRSAYLLTGDAGQAEDLLQATLLKVAPRWDRVVANGDPEAYVRTVLYREHVSSWRRHRGRELLSLDGSLPEPVAAGHDDLVVDRLAVRALLDQLTRRQRAMLVLRFYEDMSEGMTAQVLGCSVGTVRSQTARALARLRSLAPDPAEEAAR